LVQFKVAKILGVGFLKTIMKNLEDY